jgi:endo-1,4-beta-D-glucanase Y
MISDFESTPNQADMDPTGNPARKGWWYVYYPGSPNAPTGSGTQTPAVNNSGPIATAAAPDASSCNKFALHSTGSGYGGTTNNYVGFGAGFLPKDKTGQTFDAYDISKSGYTGVKFKIKAGSGTQQAVYFEMLTQDTVSSAQGGLLGAEGNPNDVPIGLHNNRGQMLNDPWTPGGITSTYQTITVPFATLVPRWVPAPGASNACPSPGAGVPLCQAPKFNPAHLLGIQFSIYQDPGFPKPSGSTAGSYDLWVDDVQFVKNDEGLQTRTGFPLASPGSMGSCIKPVGTSVGAQYLVPAYNLWKSTFVSGDHVIRPENGNDTVSEGQAYGMLIAVNMNDKDLFDKLYGYWKSHAYTGGSTLMNWCIPGGNGSCSASGGSATDADEDTAFALLQADKVFGGGTYKSDAMNMIKEIWSKDMDGGGTNLPKGGSNYQSPTGSGGLQITNASYFAPAYYKAFKAAGDTNPWDSVVTAVYAAVNGTIAGTYGLIPAWCGSTCKSPASNGDPLGNDVNYQYDSHRIPMRIGLDYCFNGAADAKTYTSKTTSFFATNASAGLNGVDRILDMYTPSGGNVSNSMPNSASILGTSAVGAMAAGNQTYLNDAYQAVFDEVNRASMAPVTAGKTPYSYYNATVGMLTLLIMNGNFSH